MLHFLMAPFGSVTQSTHHHFGWLATVVRARVGENGVESELSASLDEADCADVAGQVLHVYLT